MKVRLGWINYDFFLENKTSFAIFVGSGLKDIFHWWAHLLIFSGPFLSFLAESLTFLTTENSYVSSTNSLGEQESSEGRSFM